MRTTIIIAQVLLHILVFKNLSLAQTKSDFLSIFKEARSKEGKELLLLGIATNDSLPYKTLVIEYKDGRVRLKKKLPYLTLPGKTGFYYVQKAEAGNISYDTLDYEYSYDSAQQEIPMVKSSAELTTEIFIKNHPDTLRALLRKFFHGKSFKDRLDVGDADYSYSYIKSLIYAVPQYVTIQTYEGGYGPTGVSSSGNLDTYRIEDLSQANISAQFSAEEWQKIRRMIFFMGVAGNIGYYEHSNLPQSFRLSDYDSLDIKEFDSAKYSIDVQDLKFEVFHSKGIVMLNIIGEDKGQWNRYEGSPSLIIGGFTLTKPFVRPNTFAVSYERLQKIVPNLEDVFLSPDQNVLFLLIKKQLASFQLKAVKVPTGETLFEYDLLEKPIMAEWATGKNCDRWLSVLDQN